MTDFCTHITRPTQMHTLAQLKYGPRWCFRVCSLGICEDAGDICSTGARGGVGEVRGDKRNNQDFALVPNDWEMFLVVVGGFLYALS